MQKKCFGVNTAKGRRRKSLSRWRYRKSVWSKLLLSSAREKKCMSENARKKRLYYGKTSKKFMLSRQLRAGADKRSRSANKCARQELGAVAPRKKREEGTNVVA
jgi:hypothetical protein